MKNDKDSYTGTIDDTLEIIAPATPIQNVKVEDNIISFMFPLVDGATITCELILEGAKMNGEWTHPDGSRGIIVFEKQK